MPVKSLPIILLVCLTACKNTVENNAGKATMQQQFDKSKWILRKGMEYPYRNGMLTDLIVNYTLKGLKKDSLTHLLGQPNRSDNGYLFYTIYQDNVWYLPVPFHTKTLVIKLTRDSTVEWRKIHG